MHPAGEQQSPVNITTRGMGALEGRIDAMKVDYQSLRRASVKNTGHGAQVTPTLGLPPPATEKPAHG